MITSIFILLPAFTCLFWLLVHLIVSNRTDTYWITAGILSASTLFLFCHALYDNPASGYGLISNAALMSVLLGPCIMPLTRMYMDRLGTPGRLRGAFNLWFLVPVALFTAGTVLHLLAGHDAISAFHEDILNNGYGRVVEYRGRLEYIYFMVVNSAYHTVLAAQMIWLLCYFLYCYKHASFKFRHIGGFFRGSKAPVSEIQSYIFFMILLVFILKTPLLKTYTHTHPWPIIITAIITSMLVFLFGFVALFNARGALSPGDSRNVMRFNYGSASKGEAVEKMLDELLDDAEEEALMRVQEKIGENLHLEEWKSGDLPEEEAPQVARDIFAAVASSWEEDELFVRFQKLMMEEQLFLQPRLSLEDVAEKLGSNKTYVSRLVNSAYNVGFPELINVLRIDYAEQYILNNRGAKQDEIAAKCGFLSASSFNTTFKKITGMTPRMWVVSREGGR